MRFLTLPLVLSGLLLVPTLASADSFNIAIGSTALGINTSGTLTGNSNNDGTFTITSFTGIGITGLIAAGDPFFGNDNLVLPTQSRLFDVNGFAFTGMFSGQALSVDIFSTVAGYEALALDSSGNIYDVPASASLITAAAVTPEPSSLFLSGTGLIAIAFAFLRKRLPTALVG